MNTTTRTRLFLVTAALALLIAAPARASIFSTQRLDYDAAVISQDENSDLYRVSVTPVLIKGNITAVVNANLIFDNELRLRDQGNDVIVLDSLLWAHDRIKLRYGDLEGVTFGRGFVVNNYYSDVKNNNPDNESKALLFDTFSDRSHVTVFGTLSHLMAARGERKMGDVTVGGTIAFDSDPDLEVYAVDAKYNIFDNRWSVYAEGADITGGGNGFTLGTALTPVPKLADFTITGEYRKFDSDFAPSLIDEHYEAKPAVSYVQGVTGGKIEGFYLGADYSAGNGNSIRVFFEDYESTRSRVGGEATARLADRLNFKLFYAQENFVPSNNVRAEDTVALGTLTYALTNRFDLVLDYYRAFNDQSEPLESFSTKVVFHKKR